MRTARSSRRTPVRRKLEQVTVVRQSQRHERARTRMAKQAKRKDYWNDADYVVVGSGSSGAAVAGRLAESGARVIVLEAGKTDEKFLVKKPGMVGPMHAEPKIKRT